MPDNIDTPDNKPSPFAFSSPGKYLTSLYQYFKSKEPGLSHRYLSASMGYKSPAAFTDITKGRVIPNKKALKVLQRIFCINEEEFEFLVLLFIMQNIRNPFFKEVFFSQIVKISPKAVFSKDVL